MCVFTPPYRKCVHHHWLLKSWKVWNNHLTLSVGQCLEFKHIQLLRRRCGPLQISCSWSYSDGLWAIIRDILVSYPVAETGGGSGSGHHSTAVQLCFQLIATRAEIPVSMCWVLQALRWTTGRRNLTLKHGEGRRETMYNNLLFLFSVSKKCLEGFLSRKRVSVSITTDWSTLCI